MSTDSAISVMALADRPSPLSIAMTGLIVVRRDGQGPQYLFRGIQGPLGAGVSSRGYLLLRETNAIQELPLSVRMDLPDDGDYAGLCIGTAFTEMTHRVDIQIDPDWIKDFPSVELWGIGRFMVGRPSAVYQVIDRWMQRAFKTFFQLDSDTARKDVAIAMTWCLPDDLRTWAATWFAAPTQAEKDAHLQWFTRIQRDHGSEIHVTHGALVATFEELRARCLQGD